MTELEEADKAMGRIIAAIAPLPFEYQHIVIVNVLILSAPALEAPSTLAWAKLNADQIMRHIKGRPILTTEL